MGIGSSIWYSYAAALQPNGVRLYASLLSFTQLFLSPLKTSFLSAIFRLVWEQHTGIALAPESADAGPGTSISAFVPSANTRLPRPHLESHANAAPMSLPTAAVSPSNGTVVQGGQVCSVCALSADESCHCCDEEFCPRHIFLCAECQFWFCGNCFDLHNAEGHWSDSDTAAALAAFSHGHFESDCSNTADSLPQTREIPALTAKITSFLTTIRNSTFAQALFSCPVRRLFPVLTMVPVEAGQ